MFFKTTYFYSLNFTLKTSSPSASNTSRTNESGVHERGKSLPAVISICEQTHNRKRINITNITPRFILGSILVVTYILIDFFYSKIDYNCTLLLLKTNKYLFGHKQFI